ncbi:sigma-24, ECF subfamily [Candidatus Koribacter versatilis Ellin345]|uniref:Sigma-24, ECF subfamily n=1 Tax=Koribacter versatilis (strain Ellin345) TaxID=204669 RepID=Q1INQ3_KORVE|nr:sigma factor-like helix-turn-helix DNA-binding protein [Candidatus Koribacter versatilis]ABF41497.1 sigma-24, ECF subfamily [Candidatus Koribacter versatilis Ellin345]
MASTLQNVAISDLSFIPAFTATTSIERCKSIYEENRHRIYAFAFWMTNSELEAEHLLEATFVRAFAENSTPTSAQIDDALIAILRWECSIGPLTLKSGEVKQILNVRENTKRVHLELAVVQLPATEKLIFLMHDVEGYEHARVARALGISADESKRGLHEARLRIRELVAEMVW